MRWFVLGFRILAAALVAALSLSGAAGIAPGDDAAVERILLEARVTGSREIGSGITQPKQLTLEWGGQERKAAFKSADIEIRGATRFESARTDLQFKDSYRYEVAAYRLDRMLGLGMVPVSVIRKVEGKEGAVIDWVTDAMSEGDRRESGRAPADPTVLTRQRAVMVLFDALIQNVDRNLANQLWTPADWRLHLIDHSRGFRLWKDLPEEFAGAPASLPRALLAGLEGLEEESLAVGLERLVSRAQIKALLKRRDRILEKIASDRQQYGDAMVFQD